MRGFCKFAVAAFAAAGLVGCSGGGGGGGAHGANSLGGTARTFTRQDSAVTVTPNLSPGFTATRVVTISNDDGGAVRAAVGLHNVAGSIASSASPSAGAYQIQVTLRADAPTEEQAREALDTMSVAHRDGLGSGTLYLDHEIKYASYSANNVSRSAQVVAALPGALDHYLYQDSTSGTVTSSGLHGPEAELHSTSGAVTLSGTWDGAWADTTSGTVTVGGDIAWLQASSTSGLIQATLPSSRDTDAAFDTTSGAIDVTVTHTLGSVFDLEASTTVGSASVVVAGTEPVGTQSATHAHYRSPDYASGHPRVAAIARTTSGGVSIHE